MTDTLNCPCGGTNIEIVVASPRRIAIREDQAMRLRDLLKDAPNKPWGGEYRKEVEATRANLGQLAADVCDVRCTTCGAFVWGETKEIAVNRWNRAVERLRSLKQCCKAATDRRVDLDGMVIVKCGECGSRHMPLERTHG